MASGYFCLIARCCCINGVSEAAFAIQVAKNKAIGYLAAK